MATILATDRLVLRHLEEGDAPWMSEMDSDPEVMRFIAPPSVTGKPDVHPVSETEARDWVAILTRRYVETGSRYGIFAAVRKDTDEAVGWFILRPANEYRFAEAVEFQPDECELGYRFLRRFWGQGYATEGARALVEYAFADPTMQAVVAVALVTNGASIRVMEKAGLHRKKEYSLAGYLDAAVVYSLRR
ncbi:MAG: GNAT family N-acetyltransferase [Armatimonadaceae bacterium]